MKIRREHIDQVRESSIFDERWYQRENPDVQFLGMDPAEHFLRFGSRLGRIPSPEFANQEPWSSDVAKELLGEVLNSIGNTVVMPVSIIIPVYNAYEETRNCLSSIAVHVPANVNVIIVNDCSTDPRIKELLRQYGERENFLVHENEKNSGFTKTVNRGIQIAGKDDVILLNSDTIVTPRFVANLRRAAYSQRKVGTVTPFSNNAGAFSAPKFNQKNEIPAGFSLDEFARLVTRESRRSYPSVPTGNGFCMYVRRACIDDVGMLDEQAFPRGYGEENDFCMRGGRRGWRHVIDDATYIYHVRSVSFGEEKNELVKAGRAVLDSRYPEYGERIRCFREDAKIERARRQISSVADSAPVGSLIRPRIAFVTSTQTGGTPQTNEDLMRALQDRYETYLLRCDSKLVYFYRYTVEGFSLLSQVALSRPLEGFPHTSDEYDRCVRTILDEHQIELLHIRHIAWHGLGLMNVAKQLELPVVFSFHDFYTICPTVKLLDERDVFCGGVCTSTKGECKHELWSEPNFPALKHAGIHAWQSAMYDAVSQANAYVTTSEHAYNLIAKRFGSPISDKLHIIPHGRDLRMVPVRTVRKHRPLKVMVIGNINRQKGSDVIAAIAKIDRGRTVEFHILGQTELKRQPGVHVYGKYKRDDLPDLMAKMEPDIGAVLSIWPETFCHTLTEMWASGLAVAAFDLGAVGERLRRTKAGWLLPLLSPSEVLQEFQKIAANQSDRRSKAENVSKWQRSEGRVHTTVKMSLSYDEMYRHLLTRPRRQLPSTIASRPRVGLVVPSVGAASTQIRLIRKTRDHFQRPVRYDLLSSQDDEALVANVGDCDAVIVQRTALKGKAVDAVLAACRKAGVSVLYEIDDDLLNVPPREGETINYSGETDAIRRMLTQSDVVMVSTEELKRRFVEYNPNVKIIPNALDEKLWFRDLGDSDETRDWERSSSSEIRFIYMGSKTHGADLMMISDACEAIKRQFDNVRFFVIGGAEKVPAWATPIPVPNQVKEYPRFVPWFRAVASSMDVAIAPLMDTHFNRAKSPLKFYEYGAAGLIGLYSDVEPYRSALKDASGGVLVPNETAAWERAIREVLSKDPAERRMSAERERDYISKYHRVARTTIDFDDVVLSAITSGVQ